MKNSTIAIIVAIIIVIFAGSIWAYMRSSGNPLADSNATSTPDSNETVIAVTFRCAGGKSIDAKFYPNSDTKVDLVLSDGRTMSVPHAISASGARYANADESFVFWNKGETAFITENGTTTFADCTLPSASTGGNSSSTSSPAVSTSTGQIPPPAQASDPTVSLSGKVVCLPHKNSEGPQTMECAFGLQTPDGKYYGLKNLSNAGVEPGEIDTNMNISVTGTAVAPAVSENYAVVSNIDVKTLKKQ